MAEKKLISYDALMKHLDSCIKKGKGLSKSLCVAIKCFVEQMPAVDAVEVVRCKDCGKSREWGSEETLLCYRDETTIHVVKPDAYCDGSQRRCAAAVPDVLEFEPVVRCKDCKHRGTDYCIFHIKGEPADEELLRKLDNDFCSYGERMDGDWNG